MPWGITWLITLSASDIEGDATTAFTVVTPPAHGDVDIDPAPYDCNGLVPNVCTGPALYTPDAGYVGSDSFTYTATDGDATSAPAMVTIDVTANAAPACNNAGSSGAEDAPQGSTVTCTDAENEELTYSLVGRRAARRASTPTARGAISRAQLQRHRLVHLPGQRCQRHSNTATVSITVNPLNDAPVATPQAVATDEDTPLAITLAGTDIEAWPADLHRRRGSCVRRARAGLHRTCTYTPDADFSGHDSFSFKVNDGTADSAATVVSITVTPVERRAGLHGDHARDRQDRAGQRCRELRRRGWRRPRPPHRHTACQGHRRAVQHLLGRIHLHPECRRDRR